MVALRVSIYRGFDCFQVLICLDTGQISCHRFLLRILQDYFFINTFYRLVSKQRVRFDGCWALEYLKRELEKIADEATTDCYNEYEQIAGWCAYLEF